MKKVKYEMSVNFDLGISGLSFGLSKKEFERQLKHYTKEAEEINKTEEENNEYYIDVRKDTTEYEEYIETSYRFYQNGGSITDNLYELHFGSINVCLCKDCFITTRKKMYSIFNV